MANRSTASPSAITKWFLPESMGSSHGSVQFITLNHLVLLVLTYLLLVRILRYRVQRINDAELAKGASFSTMDVHAAQRIMRRIAGQDFPLIFKLALQFALFRTYGIPTISKLLMDTSLFAEPASASKRYADTTILIGEMMARTIGSPEWAQGLARVNCIHAKYITGGRIRNDDMLYTLALFAREPQRWIDRCEWRKLSETEKCAIGVYWKTVGDAMEIEMKGLSSYDKGNKWRDGLHWFEELCDWSDRYEVDHLIPSESNINLCQQTTAILLWTVPESYKQFGREIVGALMDKGLRRAMAYPDPSARMSLFVWRAISIRKFLIRNFAMTRPWMMRHTLLTDDLSAHGTYFLLDYESLPFYIQPGLMNRWGPRALIRRYRGLPNPGDDGDKYFPKGYTVPEVGPNHGKLGQTNMETKVKVVGQRKCPMAFT